MTETQFDLEDLIAVVAARPLPSLPQAGLDALVARHAEVALSERLSKNIDLRDVAVATAKMRQNHHPRSKQLFHSGVKVINDARDRLAEAGLGSRALDYLSNINFNRPDWDKVEHAGDVIAHVHEIEDRDAA